MCINSRIQVFNLNKIAKVLSDDTVCLSKTFSQFVTGIHTDENGQSDRRTNMQFRRQEGRQLDRQADRHSFGVEVKLVF